ncbi:MAG: glutamate-1-semialdehyde 2,1-aminomutase [bacterium]
MLHPDKSQSALMRAKRIIPGGVNSPVRAFGAVGGTPPFIQRGRGAYIYDIDGNEYIDYVLSWGPLILGHAHPAVVEAVRQTAAKGTSFGAPTEAEVELAELVQRFMPHVQMLRLVSSGTEAVMTAARLARGCTDRDLIIKFDGCYHGHSDGFLVQAGSGMATGGLPASKGVPVAMAKTTLSLPYNNLLTVEELFSRNGDQIAAVIVEPIAANMGVVPPQDGFLPGLRALTQKHSALLIFDEVITGFRVARGGASELYGVVPDLVCLGKVLGGGLPIGAVGGKEEIMRQLAPSGGVYQAGTLSGNPISVAAGIATLRELSSDGVYQQIAAATNFLSEGLREALMEAEVPAQVNAAPGLLTLFFNENQVVDFQIAKLSDPARFRAFFHLLLRSGIYLPPSPFEAWFLSLYHNRLILEETLQVVKTILPFLGRA